MSSNRKSVCFAFEDIVGGGIGKNRHWITAPPGAHISHSHNRSANRIDATGSKKFDVIAQGKYSGQWSITTYLDQDYPEILMGAFEVINNSAVKSSVTEIGGRVVNPRPEPPPIIEKLQSRKVIKILNTVGKDNYSSEQGGMGQIQKVMSKGPNDEDITEYRLSLKGTGLGEYFVVPEEYIGFARLGFKVGDKLQVINGRGEIVSEEGEEYRGALSEGDPMIVMLCEWTEGGVVKPDSGNDVYDYTRIVGKTILKIPSVQELSGSSAQGINHIGSLLDETEKAYQITRDGEPIIKEIPREYEDEEEYDYVQEYEFSKSNVGRVPSLTAREVTLNRMVDGTADEVLELRGAIIKSISFRQSAGSSQWSMTVSGWNARVYMYLEDDSSAVQYITGTDYMPHKGQLAEFACVFMDGEESNEDLITDDEKRVEVVQNFSIEINNNVEPVDSVCANYSVGYYEDKTENVVTLAMYSRDPFELQQRLFAGGKGNYDISDYLYTPLCKNLAPLPLMSIIAFNTCCRDDLDETNSGGIIYQAYEKATKSIRFDIDQLVIKSMSWQNGEGGMIQDQISSADAQDIRIKFRCGIPDILNYSKNYVRDKSGHNWPQGPAYDAVKKQWVPWSEYQAKSAKGTYEDWCGQNAIYD